MVFVRKFPLLLDASLNKWLVQWSEDETSESFGLLTSATIWCVDETVILIIHLGYNHFAYRKSL